MQSALQISRKIDYALRAAIRLAELPDQQVMSFKEIAELESIPREFLAKILRSMVSSGVVRSVRGPRGGYALARKPDHISFLDIIEAAEGPVVINMCLDGDAGCPVQGHCSMVGVWARAQDAMLKVFRDTTIRDVMRTPHLNLNNGDSPIQLPGSSCVNVSAFGGS